MEIISAKKNESLSAKEFKFNLRELVKFKDVLVNNADDQEWDFFLYYDTKITGLNENQASILKKFVKLTYSSQFCDTEDKRTINDKIEMKFKKKESKYKDLGIKRTVLLEGDTCS